MKLASEQQLLNQDVRLAIIKEIQSNANRARKDEAYKRHQCYKDHTDRYVMGQLLKQFDASTVKEMSYAMSNLGIVRKVNDKLARVYKYGVSREAVDDEAATEAIQLAVKKCPIDECFKKTNRFLKLQKNCVQYIVPKNYDLEGETKTIKPMVLPPYLYDAVMLEDDEQRAIAYVLSDYEPLELPEKLLGTGAQMMATETPNVHGKNVIEIPVYQSGDSPISHDDDKRTYVFWSDSFHFTCDSKGNIVSEGEIENPIGKMPIVNYAEDQDGDFYAQGGKDLVDGSVLVNSMITNINHIAITQGYGQIVMSGKDLPSSLKVGPNKVVKLSYMEGEPKPEFSFATANPPLDQLRALVEMYVALLLTTNNLSTSGVSTQLNGTSTFPSGIAMMIDKAESMEDVEDQRQIFVDNEPKFWDIFASWHRVLKSQGVLCEELATVDFPEDMEISVQWGRPKAIETDKERLEVLKLKQEMGLISKLDMLRSEYPNLSDEELKAKLEAIMKEAQERMAQAMEAMSGSQGSEDGEDSDSDSAGAGGEQGSERGSGRLPSGTDSDERSEEEEPDNG